MASKRERAEYMRKWYAKNREKVLSWVSRYRANNRDKVIAYDRKRYSTGSHKKKDGAKASRKAREIVSLGYARATLCAHGTLRAADIPKELALAQVELIKLKREIKKCLSTT